MALTPLETHSPGLMRSSFSRVKSRLFSGTKAQWVGSGGGVDVTARNSFPRPQKVGLNIHLNEGIEFGKDAGLTNNVMGEVIKIEVVLIISKRI